MLYWDCVSPLPTVSSSISIVFPPLLIVFPPLSTVFFFSCDYFSSSCVVISWFTELGEIVDCVALLPTTGGRVGMLDPGIFLIREMCATVWDDVSIRRSR